MEALALITGIKTAIDLAKAVHELTDSVELKSKTAQLYDSIISLQSGIMTVSEKNHLLLQSKHDLEKKLMEIEDWNETKINYELKEICAGVFVRSFKRDNNSADPQHWICANCYTNKEQGVLQRSKFNTTGTYYFCSKCNTEICDHSNKKPHPIINYPHTNDF